MEFALFLLRNTVNLALTAVQFAMLARAIFSWFPGTGGKFVEFLYAITEPFIYPIRRLFEKMNWFQGLPMDISFMISYLLISIILLFIPR